MLTYIKAFPHIYASIKMRIKVKTFSNSLLHHNECDCAGASLYITVRIIRGL